MSEYKVCPRCNGDQALRVTVLQYILTCGDCEYIQVVDRTFRPEVTSLMEKYEPDYKSDA